SRFALPRSGESDDPGSNWERAPRHQKGQGPCRSRSSVASARPSGTQRTAAWRSQSQSPSWRSASVGDYARDCATRAAAAVRSLLQILQGKDLLADRRVEDDLFVCDRRLFNHLLTRLVQG